MGISSMAPNTPRTTESTKHQWSYPSHHVSTPTPQKLTAYKKLVVIFPKSIPIITFFISLYNTTVLMVLTNWGSLWLFNIAIEAMAHLVRWKKWWLTSQKWWWPMSFQKTKKKKVLKSRIISQKKLASKKNSSIPEKNKKISPLISHETTGSLVFQLVAPQGVTPCRGAPATSDGSLHGRAKGSHGRGSPCRRLNSCHLGGIFSWRFLLLVMGDFFSWLTW